MKRSLRVILPVGLAVILLAVVLLVILLPGGEEDPAVTTVPAVTTSPAVTTAPTVTTVPVATTTPVTTAPVTTAPVTTAPVTTAPVTTAPVTTAPVTTSPVTAEPPHVHTPVTDPAVPATCTADGKTEGSHCGVCGDTIVAQAAVPSPGHQYDAGTVLTPATCLGEGTKKFTCTVADCRHSYTAPYSLPTLSAAELGDLTARYTGEIVAYDRLGAELSRGACFVWGGDGRLVTAYRVIDGAYSAEVTLCGVFYPVQAVLAYDGESGLAVLGIDAADLTAATVCTSPVGVGQTVYAVRADGGRVTCTQGTVTSADHAVEGVSYVQHGAALTEGNSGGPLLNAYGEVIGINLPQASDSPDSSLAVLADGLEKLSYDGPHSLAELYELHRTPYETLCDFVLENGTVADGHYSYYADDAGTRYGLRYGISDRTLSVTAEMSGGQYLFLIELRPDTTEFAYVGTFDDPAIDAYDTKTYGFVYGNSFTGEDTPLEYTAYEGATAGLALHMQTFTYSAELCLSWLFDLLAAEGLGVTLSDLGFSAFAPIGAT